MLVPEAGQNLRLQRCRNVADLRELARRRLPSPVFDFLEGGADDEVTSGRNTRAFEEYALLPRVLVNVGNIDLSTSVFGQRIDFPIIIAPTGGNRLFHHEGELAVSRAAAHAGIMYSLATYSTFSIEQVARESNGPRLFQLYVTRDSGLNHELLRRARDAGFAALCLTVDCPVNGNRERDLRSGLATRPRRIGPGALASMLAHPGWLFRFLRRPELLPANLVRRSEAGGDDRSEVTAAESWDVNPSVTWANAAKLILEWNGPTAIKGILSAEDARRASDIGATAVVVSNHGGRQLDGTVATVDALSRIVDAVSGQMEVILDGGIRRGTHVLKAVALGATACMIGRPYLYGLAAGGQAGVARALAILRCELARDMALLGCTNLRVLDSSYIEHR